MGWKTDSAGQTTAIADRDTSKARERNFLVAKKIKLPWHNPINSIVEFLFQMDAMGQPGNNAEKAGYALFKRSFSSFLAFPQPLTWFKNLKRSFPYSAAQLWN